MTAGARRAPRLAFIVTTPVTAKVLLRGQLSYLRERGFDVSVICAPGPELDVVAQRELVRTIAVPIAREIDPRRDAVSLARLARALHQLAPDIVNASTTKAGLLGMLAAAGVRVPVRIYTLRGLRLETEVGTKRTVLAGAERLASACANHVVCVSHTLRERYIAGGFCSPERCVVLGPGSSNGVDAARFERTAPRIAEALELRQRLGIPANAPVIGFVGRPVCDKGIGELLAAFRKVTKARSDAHLVIVGAGLAGDGAEMVAEHDRVSIVDHVDEPAPYYAMMDVLAFPSHREGFPNAPLEAAACGVPTVGFVATGTRDAIVDGVTGSLVDHGDIAGFAERLLRYVCDDAIRSAHGQAARERALRDFAREQVWARWYDHYVALLRARALPLPHAAGPNSGI